MLPLLEPISTTDKMEAERTAWARFQGGSFLAPAHEESQVASCAGHIVSCDVLFTPVCLLPDLPGAGSSFVCICGPDYLQPRQHRQSDTDHSRLIGYFRRSNDPGAANFRHGPGPFHSRYPGIPSPLIFLGISIRHSGYDIYFEGRQVIGILEKVQFEASLRLTCISNHLHRMPRYLTSYN